jgi:hypothetical protein
VAAAGWWIAGWWTAERLTAAAIVGQLLVFAGQLAVLVVAARYASNQVKGIRDQVEEARELRASQALQAQELREAERELRKDEARPYVVVDFERDRAPLVNLVIANLGRTMARNVRIEVDPPFDSSVYRDGPLPLAGFKLFAKGIPSLAPGKRIVLLFDHMIDREKLDLPDSYRVRLAYEWDGGDPLSDVLRLDLDLYRPLRQVEWHTIHDVSKTLKQIVQRFDRWTAGHDGLLVLSPEDQRRRNEEIMADMEQRRREAAEQHAAADDQPPGTAGPG